MEFGQLFARLGEGAEVGGEGNPRQLAFEVVGELFPIARMMEHAVDVMENVPLAHLFVVVVSAELIQRPIGDVLAAIRAVFVVDVEREAL